MEDDLIWYVCYGSNLCYRRFECYITGEEDKELGVGPSEGFKDKTLPKESKVVTIPYKLYFAERSSRWEHKGVAFLDLTYDPKCKTIGRAYLIKRSQLEDLKDREGRSWYGNDSLKLDDIEGKKAFTLTSFEKKIENAPGELYRKVIKRGLLECGLSEDEANEYIATFIVK